MKKLTLAAILASTATLGVAGYAYADQHRGGGHHMGGGHMGGGMMLEQLDANGDGQITKAEVEAMKAEKFAEADTDSDGNLTMDELEAFHQAERARRMQERRERRFARADENGDGVISADEFGMRGMPMFDRLDANDDDVISADEIEAMKERHGKRGWRHHRGGDDQQ